MSVPNPYAGAVIDQPRPAQRSFPRPRPAWISKGIPLRFGVIFIVVLVSAVGLAVSALAINKTMSELVFSRIDADLEAGMSGWATQDSLFRQPSGTTTRPPTDFYVVKWYANGSTVEFNEHGSAPDLSGLDFTKGETTVGSQNYDGTVWRVLAQQRDGVTTVVAKDITRESLILKRLAIGQIIIGFAVLLVTGLLAFFMLHRALRPLRQVEETAKAIARGNLDRRVPESPENTEVGALSHSLNVMLERLQGSIVELQSKEEQMRRFVGDASHELRTPLTSVKGYAELYRSGACRDANLVVERVEAEASRMSMLVEDLLALTRAEGARFEESNVDLLELSLSVAGSLRAAYPDRQIDVRSELEDVPVVRGDAGRLHQVITNLVVNGLKHGGEDAKVLVTLADGDSRNRPGSVLIEVSDDGQGMSEEDAAHIFERFYRADSSRNRATGGSGLGLAITKSLVESHHGSIEVSTKQGLGTTFVVALPKG